MNGAALAAARAAEGAPRPLAVLGSGPLADELRALLGEGGDGARPATVVVAAGELDEIRRAFGLARDLGTVVLAVAPAEEGDVDLYADVHVRGLTVLGAGEPER